MRELEDLRLEVVRLRENRVTETRSAACSPIPLQVTGSDACAPRRFMEGTVLSVASSAISVVERETSVPQRQEDAFITEDIKPLAALITSLALTVQRALFLKAGIVLEPLSHKTASDSKDGKQELSTLCTEIITRVSHLGGLDPKACTGLSVVQAYSLGLRDRSTQTCRSRTAQNRALTSLSSFVLSTRTLVHHCLVLFFAAWLVFPDFACFEFILCVKTFFFICCIRPTC